MADEAKNLIAYDGNDSVVESRWWQEELKKGEGKVWWTPSGFNKLDDLICGFYDGELTVITGPTKNGKTLFAQTLTRNFAANTTPCLWFSYEVPARQFLDQFGDDLPIFYLPKQLKGRAMPWLRERMVEAKQKFGTRIVFIDHLHFLIDMATSSNASMHIGAIMRQLKHYAITEGYHIFLVAHMAKVTKDKDGTWRDPEAGDTRDSSFIEQECDNTFAIWRSREADNRARLKIIHNRRYGVFEEIVELRKEGPYLEEYQKGWAD